MESEFCKYLSWDSAFFHQRIARVTSSRLTPAAACAVDDWCREQRIDCLYFLADLDDPLTLRLAEEHSFRLVDVRVTLEAPLSRPNSRTVARQSGAVRRFREEDAAALRKLARESHRDSRFYCDGRFPDEACDRLYERWIERSWENPANAVFVADLGHGAVGYATAHRASDVEGCLGLIAVDPGAQGKGLGRQLTAAVLDWCGNEHLEVLQVVTQGRNSRALRLYSQSGFLPRVLQVWYHRWFSPPYYETSDGKK